MGDEKLTRRYGPYTWVTGTHWYVRPVYVGVKYAPIYTGRKYGPHVRVVFMGSAYQPLQTLTAKLSWGTNAGKNRVEDAERIDKHVSLTDEIANGDTKLGYNSGTSQCDMSVDILTTATQLYEKLATVSITEPLQNRQHEHVQNP